MTPIPGRPPDLLDPPPGCAFAPRCNYAQSDCTEAVPSLVEAAPGRFHACLHPVGAVSALERKDS